MKGLLNRTLKDKITEAWQLLRQGGGGADGAKRKRGREGATFFPGRGAGGEGGLSAVSSLPSCCGTPGQRETMAQPSALPAHPSSAPQVSAILEGCPDGPCLPLHGPSRTAPDETLLGLPSPPAWITAHFMPAGWCLLEVIMRPSPTPCQQHARVSFLEGPCSQ